MTEQGGSYNFDGKPKTSPEARQLVKSFVTALSKFKERNDYFSFCEVLDIEPSELAWEKHCWFLEAVQLLNQFTPEELARLVDVGDGR
ncbi:hypothetical protein [Scytonema sp. PCC 10023]|uniref:hypothetical protein n=1 Tax=Scytonema sp. PCC 10023 TaxID=1680591 RepID=UPI0039C6FDA4